MDEKTVSEMRFMTMIGYAGLVILTLDEMVQNEQIDIDTHHELVDMMKDLQRRFNPNR